MSQTEDTKVRLRYYRSTLRSVALASQKYLDELERNDNAHWGRLTKRENALRGAVFECANAWNDRFKPLTELQRAYATFGSDDGRDS